MPTETPTMKPSRNPSTVTGVYSLVWNAALQWRGRQVSRVRRTYGARLQPPHIGLPLPSSILRATRALANGRARSGWALVLRSRTSLTALSRSEVSPAWFLIRMAGVPKRDPVANYRGTTQQPGALDGVLSEAVANRVDRPLQALAAGR
jgi:hypothetical protein